MISHDSVLILGATSDIGRAIARAYAETKRPLILAARSCERLTVQAEDLRIRYGIFVKIAEFDVLDTAGHRAFLEGLGEIPQTAICVVGLMGNQQECERNFAVAETVMRTNFCGPASILGELASQMGARGYGCIIGVSSVAGDRGRAANYIYGSAKAGFTAFLSGVRNRLATKGVSVITVKPGLVDTRMTAGMKLPKPLLAQPQEVAEAIIKAEKQGRDVIYVLPIWRLLMSIICFLPERLFKKLKI